MMEMRYDPLYLIVVVLVIVLLVGLILWVF